MLCMGSGLYLFLQCFVVVAVAFNKILTGVPQAVLTLLLAGCNNNKNNGNVYVQFFHLECTVPQKSKE